MYPDEELHEDIDDGTMPASLDDLRHAVVGHKIVKVEHKEATGWYENGLTTITLDSGKVVEMIGTDDCCAMTEVESFLLHPEMVDHMIMGVGTTDHYDTWHIYADAGDILQLNVAWSCGNPFYYGYGFNIRVRDIEEESK